MGANGVGEADRCLISDNLNSQRQEECLNQTLARLFQQNQILMAIVDHSRRAEFWADFLNLRSGNSSNRQVETLAGWIQLEATPPRPETDS